MRWSNVRLILSREVRDQLRDRRTLFMIAVLPLLLYPLMGISFMQLAQFLQRHPSRVLIVAEQPLPNDPPLIVENEVVGIPAKDAALLQVDFRQDELPLPAKAAQQATAIIDQDDYDIVVCFPAAFCERLREHELSEQRGDAALRRLMMPIWQRSP